MVLVAFLKSTSHGERIQLERILLLDSGVVILSRLLMAVRVERSLDKELKLLPRQSADEFRGYHALGADVPQLVRNRLVERKLRESFPIGDLPPLGALVGPLNPVDRRTIQDLKALANPVGELRIDCVALVDRHKPGPMHVPSVHAQATNSTKESW